MISRKLILPVFALVLLLPSIAGAEAGLSAAEKDALRTDITRLLNDSPIDRAAISLRRNDDFLHIRYAKHGTLSSDATFRAGSLSKLLTSLAILRAQEQGLLALDDQVTAHLPGIISAPTHPTIAQLLEHTGGLAGSTYADYAEQASNISPTDFVAQHSPFTLRWQPGLHYSYANSGHTIAGAILEKVYQTDFDQIMAQQVFAPLGMTRSHFRNTRAASPQLVPTYDADGIEISPLWQMSVRPSGSLVTTIDDLERLQTMLLDRGKLPNSSTFLPAAVIQRMESGQTSLAARSGAHDGTYGLGKFGFVAAGHIFRGHWGKTDGFRTNFGYRAADASGFIIMVNSPSDGAIHRIRERLAKAIVGEEKAPPPSPQPIAIERNLGGTFVGISHDMPMRSWLFGLLTAAHIDVGHDSITVSPVLPIHPQRTFTHVGNSLFQAQGVPVATAVLTRSNGQVIFADGESMQRVSSSVVYLQLAALLSATVSSLLAVFLLSIALIRKKATLSIVSASIAGLSFIGLALAFYYNGLAGSGRALGLVSLPSLMLLIVSVLFPIGALLALWKGRLLTRTLAALMMPAAALLFYRGWIPLITWLG